MNDFFDWVLINWLKTYDHGYQGDMALRAITTRFDDNPNHHQWIDYYNTVTKEFLAIPGKSEFTPPREMLSKDDVRNMIDLAIKDRPTFEFSTGAEVLADVLELTHAEKMFLNFAIRAECAPYSYREIFDNLNFNAPNRQSDALYAKLFELDEGEVTRAREGFLFASGLLNFGDSVKTYPQLHEDMSGILVKDDLTVESLAKELFPSNISTELTVDNYPHLATEIALCEKIVNTSLKERSRGINVLFWGLAGAGKTELAFALAKKNGWNLRVIGDYSEGAADEKSRAQRLTSLKVALKLYSKDENTVLLFDEIEDLFKMDLNASFSKAFINRTIESATIPIIWTTNELEMLGQPVLRRMSYNLAFETPPRAARADMWRHYCDKHKVNLPEGQIDDFAMDFKIQPALIGNAVQIARMTGVEGDDLTKVITSLERLVNYGCKRRPTVKARTDIPYSTAYINTPTDLSRLTSRLEKVTCGFSMVLHGPSGTGKSEFARHVAGLMGKTVLYKKYSELAGMYVGETEANIAAAFEEARRESMVLIMDECDSLLTDRSTADRHYQVTATNEMLVQMENPDVVFFATTNLQAHLDQAVLRRFTWKLHFDYLDGQRAKDLFEAYFKKPAPDDILRIETLTPGDFDLVSKRAKILDVDDADELYDMLLEELEQKSVKGTKIGF